MMGVTTSAEDREVDVVPGFDTLFVATDRRPDAMDIRMDERRLDSRVAGVITIRAQAEGIDTVATGRISVLRPGRRDSWEPVGAYTIVILDNEMFSLELEGVEEKDELSPARLRP